MTAPTVKVKPLEWEAFTTDEGTDGWRARTSIGVYLAVAYGWFLVGQSGWNEAKTAPSARAAAQADYEARILSAIDTTDLEALAGAVLAEAAEQGADIAQRTRPEGMPYEASMAYHTGAMDVVDAIRALNTSAITALDRAKREARVEGMREAWELCEDYGFSKAEECRDAIFALIEAERGKP